MSLSPTATTMLYAIGAGKQVVAVDKNSTYPAQTPVTPLDGFETSPESYIPYHPDLVVLAQDQAGTLAGQLAGLGIPTLILPAANTLADTYAQFTILGKATGHVSAAAAENASIKARLASIVHSVGTRARGQTYYQELDPTLYTATSRTFIGALYGMLGMKNIADAAIASGDDYPQLSPEALIQSSPNYVFLADGGCCGQSAATFAARAGYATIGAVQHHHIYVIPDSVASQWGPRVVTFLQMVADDVTGSTPGTGS
jgi:iron complex transport system substrate-binding protein